MCRGMRNGRRCGRDKRARLLPISIVDIRKFADIANYVAAVAVVNGVNGMIKSQRIMLDPIRKETRDAYDVGFESIR